MANQPAGQLLPLLKTYSLLLVLLAAAALSAWAVYALPAPVVDRMLEADLRKQATDWRRRILLHLEDGGGTFLSGQLDAHDIEYLSLLPETTEAYRIKLFQADGRVLWSTRPADIGTVNREPYFQQIVAKGAVYYAQDSKPVAQIDGFETRDTGAMAATRDVAEIYTPVLQGGRFAGAVEFYADITALRETFLNRVRISLALVSAVMVAAIGIVSLTVIRTNRFSLRQMQQRAAKDQEIMASQMQLAREVKLLGELNEWLQSCRSLDELFKMVSEFMSHLLPDAEGSIYVFSNSRDVLAGCASWNGGALKDHIRPDECWGLRRGRTYEFGASEVEFTCAHAVPHDGRSYFCFPILAHGETVGLMHLRAMPPRAGDFATCKPLAQMCAEQISMAIANVRMRDQLHDQSVRDPLTGLFNRRHMTESLRKFLSSSALNCARLSVIAVDVDHFKKFNDNHGHDAGDMVLRAVSTVLDKACDGSEAACRPGGEEFTLILPGVPPEDALTRAELLRQAVEEITVRYGEKTLPQITISAGVAHYPAHGLLPQDLLRAADEALYAAKAKGRNQVCVAATSAEAGQDAEWRAAEQAASARGPAEGSNKAG
ncbi:sensor domain-containing diguanylate cyclase [Leisingera aquaemixtae]|uniref:sensor domain-containing diguanylate cyclase n=1 Tax=Leisingera aquaemixtae TaxID=1396826 RepID=UPI0021A79066|nr:sensor domain-containing diguanylate cyclase [Leisingera aquaemixtae]UWQ23623.1 sensor domain-containing diguanylate cyclase [Leisingera aquaemixtae]UWQ44514.1 sensor domain-containing diguanylate cyclase [Leisingera aquaemixtae]